MMPIKGTFFFTLLAVVTTINLAFSQDPFKDVNVASPNAAAIQKFVDVPVNTHTGIPQISIPIYTFNEGSLSMPVSLDYHAGGLKVQEYSSWVGAGWSLNAGGVITRTVQGHPDERSPYSGNLHFMHEGGYENYLYLSNEAIVESLTGDLCGRDDVNGASYDANLDLEPDLFFFNVNGMSGKFYVGPDYKAVMVPEQPLHIEIDLEDTDGLEIDGWTITDQNGVKYYFGRTHLTGTVEPIELNDIFTKEDYSVAGKTVSSWYLHTVESPLGDQIKLNYENEKYATYSISLNYSDASNAVPYDGISLSKIYIRGVRLSSITSTSASVDFVESSQARRDVMRYQTGDWLGDKSNEGSYPGNSEAAKFLARIDVSNTSDFCKSFVFEQDYWVDETPVRGVFAPGTDYGGLVGTLETDKHRLYLKGIQETSCNTIEQIPPYNFHYYNEDRVPRKFSFSMDHWGFYNGAENDNLTPIVGGHGGVSPTQNPADRESRWPEMRVGALKRIQYPTGGGSEYLYGHHILSNLEECDEVINPAIFNTESVFTTDPQSLTNFPHCSAPDQVTIPEDKEGVFLSFQFNGTEYDGYLEFDGVKYNSDQTIDVIPGSTYNFTACLTSVGSASGGIIVHMYFVDYESCVEKKYTVGGLRIEKIVLNDGSKSPELVTEYKYTNIAGKSSGVLFGQPKYKAVIRNNENRYQTSGAYTGYEPYWTKEGCVKYTTDENVFYTASGPQSINPLKSTQGSHFGYRDVIKVRSEGYEVFTYDVRGGILLGKPSIKEVDNSVCKMSYEEYPFLPEPHAFGRGDLINHQLYDKTSNLLKETQFTYVYDINPTGVIAGIRKRLWDPNATYNVSRYTIKTGHLSRKEDINRSYFPSGTLETLSVTDFNSRYPYTPSSTKLIDLSTSEVLSQVDYTYATDLVNEGRGCAINLKQCYQQYITDSVQVANTFQTAVNKCLVKDDSGCDYGCFINDSGNEECPDWRNCPRDQYLIYIYDLNELRKQLKQCVSTAYNDQATCWEQARASTEIDKAVDLITSHRESTIIEQVQYKNQVVTRAYYFDFDDELRVNKICERGTEEGFEPVASYNEDPTFDNQQAGFDGITGYKPMESITIPSDREGVKLTFHIDDGVVGYLEFDGKSYYDDQVINLTSGSTYNYRLYVSSAGSTGNGIRVDMALVDFSFKKDDNYRLAQSLKYDGERIIEIINKDGITTSFLWAVEGTNDFDHPIAKVVGASYNLVNSIYTANPDLDALSSHPDLSNAHVFTYAYEQAKGLIKATDPNGQVTEYEYDDLGRLSLIFNQEKVVKKIEYRYSN